MIELIHVRPRYFDRVRSARETSEMRKYKHAYETRDGRWRIERAYGRCGGGWRIDNQTTVGTPDPVTVTGTLAAAKAFVTEWAVTTGSRDEQYAGLNRSERVAQWLLAAVTADDDVLGELQDRTEQECACCTAVVTRALAKMAAFYSVRLHGQNDAEHQAEQLLADCLDEIAELEH